MSTETVASIDWRPGGVRWLLPLLTYAVAAWGAYELTLQRSWGGWWLAALACCAWVDVRRMHRQKDVRRLRLHGATIEVDDDECAVERAWLGPFGTAIWLRSDAGASRLLMIYRSEMSKTSYATLRRHLKLWVPR